MLTLVCEPTVQPPQPFYSSVLKLSRFHIQSGRLRLMIRVRINFEIGVRIIVWVDVRVMVGVSKLLRSG